MPTRRCGPPRRTSSASTAGALVALLLASVTVAAEVNRIVLRVNDRIATLYDYELRLAERIAAIQRSELAPARQQELISKAAENTMRDIYEDLLVLSRADQLGVQPPPEEIERMVAQARESFGIESEDEFELALARSGVTREGFREQMRRNFLIRAVMGREVQPRVEVTEEDLRRYYRDNPDEFKVAERVRLREVVVLEESGLSSEEMVAIAQDIRRQAAAGTPLEEAVRPFSEKGQTTAVIELGWIGSEDLDDNLEAAVAATAAGDYSMPVAARGGLHLVEVVERQESYLRSYEDVVEEIQGRERDRRFSEELKTYLSELKNKSFVRADPPPEAAGFLVEVESDAEPALQGIEDLRTAVETPSEEPAAGDPAPAEPGADDELPAADPEAPTSDIP